MVVEGDAARQDSQQPRMNAQLSLRGPCLALSAAPCRTTLAFSNVSQGCTTSFDVADLRETQETFEKGKRITENRSWKSEQGKQRKRFIEM